MSNEDKDSRIDQLLNSFDTLQVSGKQTQALAALKEATVLSSVDVRILEAWRKIAGEHVVDLDPINLCRLYVESGEKDWGEKALAALEKAQLSEIQAETLLSILIHKEGPALRSDLVANVLSKPVGRIAFVKILTQDTAQPLLGKLCSCTEVAVDAAVNALLDTNAKGIANHRPPDMIRLCGQLVDQLESSESKSRANAMRALAKLVSAGSFRLDTLVTKQHINSLLCQLHVRRPRSIRVQATLVLAKLYAASSKRFDTIVYDFITSRFPNKMPADITMAVSVAASLFSVSQKTIADFILTDNLLDTLLDPGLAHDEDFPMALLELLSAACNDKRCRENISSKAISYIMDKIRFDDEARIRDVSALIMAKLIGANQQPKAVTAQDEHMVWNTLRESLTSKDGRQYETAIEGLAYLSSQSSMKEAIAQDSSLLKGLFKVMQEPEGYASILFGALTTISNVVTYAPVQDLNDRQMSQLKAYASQNPNSAADPLNDDQHVDARCKKLIDSGLVPTIVKISKLTQAMVVQQISQIVLALSKAPKVRGILVQQGLFDVIVRYTLIDATNNITAAEAQYRAAYSLARILVSTNPALLFRSRPVESCIRPLTTLLSLSETQGIMSDDTQGRDLAPVFESLRALTNLASMSEEARNMVTIHALSYITQRLWSTNAAILQAAMECIVNLTVSYTAVQYLLDVPSAKDVSLSTKESSDGSSNANESKADNTNNNTLHLISALSHSHTPGIRNTAAATLAHILAWDIGVLAFLKLERGVENMVGCIKEAVEEGDMELLVRTVMAIWLLLETSKEQAGSTAISGNVSSKQISLFEQSKQKLGKAGGLQLFQQLGKAGIGKGEDLGEMIKSVSESLKP